MRSTPLLGLLLFSGAVFGFFATWPKFQDYQVLHFELREREQELHNQEAYYADLAKVQQELSRFPEQLAKIEAALPTSPQLPVLYDFLQTSAALSGISVRSITASTQGKTQDFNLRETSATLGLSGSYTALKELMSRLRVASRITSLQNFSLSGSADPESFQITLQLKVYSY